MADYDAIKIQYSKPDCTSPPNGPNRLQHTEHPVEASSCDRLSPKLRNYGEQETN